LDYFHSPKGNIMSYSDYVIKNCTAQDAERACPKRWSALVPAFSDMVRHCVHCNKKVYLCETEEQSKFYTSVKFRIAVADPEQRLNVERNTPSSIPSPSNGAAPAKQGHIGIFTVDRSAPNVWRRPQPSEHVNDQKLKDMPAPQGNPQTAEDPAIPAFLRKKKK
jgi:hypothetical protein